MNITDEKQKCSSSEWERALNNGDPCGVKNGIKNGFLDTPISFGNIFISPLTYTCMTYTKDDWNFFQIAKLLLDANASVNECRPFAALHDACDKEEPSLRIIQLLVEARADITLADNTAFGMFIQCVTMSLLRRHGVALACIQGKPILSRAKISYSCGHVFVATNIAMGIIQTNKCGNRK